MRGREGRVVVVTNAQCMLGVRVPDRSRAILVVTVDGELAVAVRDAVSPGMAVVRDARSEDAGAIAASCLPWPWMVVGSAVSLSPALAAVLRDRPVLTYWFGAAPAGLPGHARVFDRPAALLDAVGRACVATVGGMRLAPGNGVELEDGTLLRGAALESLVAAYPAGFALPTRTFRSAASALAQYHVGWEARRDTNQSTRLVRSPVAAAR
ncbi:MAG: hypothetical protein WAL77_00920 [Candidatus Dormiibacterota bacterium]